MIIWVCYFLGLSERDIRLRFLFSIILFFWATSILADQLEVHSPSDGFLNLRSGPGTDYRILAEMRNGQLVSGDEVQGNWLRVGTSNGLVGWAHRGYLIAPGTPSHGFFERNECALQIASRPDLDGVRDVLENLESTRYAQVFRASNGWYAISVGTLRPHEIEPVVRDWKASGRIPQDSFCYNGQNYISELSVASILNERPFQNSGGTPNSTRGCLGVDLEHEVSACYYRAFGPKLCTQAVSEHTIPGQDTYFDRVAISGTCSAAVNSSLAEDYIPNDLMFTAFEELVETGCETINSDNLLAQLFVGLPSCVGNVALWARRSDLARNCAREVIRQCG